MDSDIPISPQNFALADLCVLVDLPPRTVRYYVQIGLVDKPHGETRAARYGAQCVEQLLMIKKWAAAGVSLDRVRELLHGEQPPVAARVRAAGSIDVKSHLMVTDGIEVVIEPGRAGMSPEQVRAFIKKVVAAHEEVVDGATEVVPSTDTKIKN